MKTRRGRAVLIGWNPHTKRDIYQVPEGYGRHSGKLISTPDFEYNVEEPIINRKLLLLL